MPKTKILILSSIIVVVALIFSFGAKYNVRIDDVQQIIKNLGIFAPFIFILLYVFGPIFFVPIIPLSITGGILFGPLFGTIYSIIGATISGCLAFLTGRYLMKDYINKKMSLKSLFMNKMVAEEGWKFIIIARITPIFPFGAQNYLFGITNIRLKTFFWASFIGLLPGTFAYVYLGYAGKNILQGGYKSLLLITIALIVLTLITILPYYWRKKAVQSQENT